VAFQERLARHDLTLRPITTEDELFLVHVYRGTREDELALTNWSDVQKDSFVRMQFTAQHAHYQQHFSDAAFDVLLHRGAPIGRLYVDRTGDDILLIDIALVREARGAGIGTAILHALQDEARETRKPLALYVEKFNPARRLYDRLGFQPVDEGDVYWFMRWHPPTP
jgi:GNAT superfamily N-acetyltransferase